MRPYLKKQTHRKKKKKERRKSRYHESLCRKAEGISFWVWGMAKLAVEKKNANLESPWARNILTSVWLWPWVWAYAGRSSLSLTSLPAGWWRRTTHARASQEPLPACRLCIHLWIPLVGQFPLFLCGEGFYSTGKLEQVVLDRVIELWVKLRGRLECLVND